jgi:5'-nucleotidase
MVVYLAFKDGDIFPNIRELKKQMKILLTNDDGIESRSLNELWKRLAKEHDVWVVAPSEQKSACSHSINIKDAVRFKEIEPRVFACYGTTVDCVLISLRGFIKEEIDMVISGINLGPNLGTDIIYSGTAGGARQGALMGKPSIAASSYSRDEDADYTCQIGFLAKNLGLFARLWSADHFININFPLSYNNGNPVAITFPARRTYTDRLRTQEQSDGTVSIVVEGDEPGAIEEAGSDYDAVKKNKVSISPVLVHPGRLVDWENYQTATFEPWNGRCHK